MVDGDFLDMIEKVARRVRGSAEPFGGLQVLLLPQRFAYSPALHFPATGSCNSAACWFDQRTWNR